MLTPHCPSRTAQYIPGLVLIDVLQFGRINSDASTPHPRLKMYLEIWLRNHFHISSILNAKGKISISWNNNLMTPVLSAAIFLLAHWELFLTHPLPPIEGDDWVFLCWPLIMGSESNSVKPFMSVLPQDTFKWFNKYIVTAASALGTMLPESTRLPNLAHKSHRNSSKSN